MRMTRILFPLQLNKDVENERHESMTSLYSKIRDMLNIFAKEMPVPVLTLDEFLTKIGICEAQFLARRIGEICINNYNSTILHLFHSNMDLQFITNCYSIASYLGKYGVERPVCNGLSEVLSL